MNKPMAGTIWRHANGGRYFVLCISNTATVRENHPPDVVYLTFEDGSGPNYEKVWTRPLATWHEKMTLE